MRTLLLTLITLTLFTTATLAQGMMCNHKADPFIEVTGSAEMEITPDEVYLAITMKEFMDGKDKVTLEKLEKQLVKAVEGAGMNKEQLGIDDLNSQFRKYKRKKEDVFEQRTYQLKITDMEQLAAFMNSIQDLDIFSLDVAKVSHSEIERFRKEVKIMAAKAAKDKAGYLLEAMDAKVGKPLEVVEVEAFQNLYNRSLLSNTVSQYTMESENYESDLEFKPIILRYKVKAKFAIMEE